MKSYVTFLGAVLLASGCSKPAAPVAPAPPTSPVATNEQPTTSTPSTPSTSSATDTTDQSKSPGPTIDQIPAEIKTDAFEYEGLANTQLQKFVDTTSTGTPSTGTFQVTLKEIKDGKATFEEVSTGGQDGGETEKMSADATGVYHEELSPAKLLIPHVLELPAKLGPGTAWTDKTEIDAGSSGSNKVISLNDANKVVGINHITTKLGSFDALEVDTTGVGTFDKEPISVTEKRWFVKGVGTVKQTYSMKLKTGTSNVSREFTK